MYCINFFQILLSFYSLTKQLERIPSGKLAFDLSALCSSASLCNDIETEISNKNTVSNTSQNSALKPTPCKRNVSKRNKTVVKNYAKIVSDIILKSDRFYKPELFKIRTHTTSGREIMYPETTRKRFSKPLSACDSFLHKKRPVENLAESKSEKDLRSSILKTLPPSSPGFVKVICDQFILSEKQNSLIDKSGVQINVPQDSTSAKETCKNYSKESLISEHLGSINSINYKRDISYINFANCEIDKQFDSIYLNGTDKNKSSMKSLDINVTDNRTNGHFDKSQKNNSFSNFLDAQTNDFRDTIQQKIHSEGSLISFEANLTNLKKADECSNLRTHNDRNINLRNNNVLDKANEDRIGYKNYSIESLNSFDSHLSSLNPTPLPGRSFCRIIVENEPVSLTQCFLCMMILKISQI